MATATLVFVGNRRLRYLLASEGPATVIIPSKGGVSPDLLSDSVAGPVKQLARAPLDGYRTYPVGPLTRSQARSLWLDLARVGVSARSGFAAYTIDADVDREGRPQLVVTVDRAATAYLDIEV